MIRYVTSALVLVALAIGIHPLRASPPNLVVQTWHYDPQAHAVVVRLINEGGKDITGWTIKIKETYDNGQTNEHEYSTDMLAGMLAVQQFAGTVDGESLRQRLGNGTFQAGTSRDIPIGVAHPITNFESTITVVLYANKTGEATDQEAFNRMVSARSVAASTMQKASAVIKKALLTSSPNPHEAAASELQQMVVVWKAQNHTTLDLDTGQLEGIIRDLRNAPKVSAGQNVTVKEYLTTYAAEQDRRTSTLSEHSTLTRVGVGVGGTQ